LAVERLGTRDIEISALTYFPGNARRGNLAEIRKSVRRLGQYRSVVVRDTGSELVILAGNHTVQAMADEGLETASCGVIRCTDDEARRVAVADNRLAELGGYDDDALVELLSYLDDDYEGTGWTAEDVEALITPPEDFGGSGDPDDVPEPPAEPVSAPGDLWRIGPHRLLVGDATDMAAVEAMLAGDRCDCMWTDPPYGVAIVGGSHALTPAERLARGGKTIQNDASADDLPDLLAGAYAVATAALKPGAPVYIAYPARLRQIFDQAMIGAGWQYRQELIWVKDSLVLGRNDYHYRHEGILYGFTPGGEGRLGRGGDYWQGDDAQTSVFEIPKPSRSEDHPTMKPVALVTAMLANSCPPKGLVYEPFGGSGTTLIAAHELGRRSAVVELDPRYADVILRRAEGYLGIKPERVLSDGTTEPVTFTG